MLLRGIYETFFAGVDPWTIVAILICASVLGIMWFLYEAGLTLLFMFVGGAATQTRKRRRRKYTKRSAHLRQPQSSRR